MQNLTAFPVTFHDLDVISGNNQFLMGSTKKSVFCETPLFSIGDRIFNQASLCSTSQILLQAHNLIRNVNWTPYEAWAVVTGHAENLGRITGFSPKEIDLLFNDPEFLPPAGTVKKFCFGIGVHPAHLFPGLHNEKLSYPYAVLRVMADMLDDKNTTSKDRDLCLRAFKSEQERCEDIFNSPGNNYGRHAFSKLKKACDSLKKKPRVCLSQHNLQTSFNEIVPPCANDIEAAVEWHERSLVVKLGELKIDREQKAFTVAETEENLRSLGDLIYGYRHSHKTVTEVIDAFQEAFQKQGHKLKFSVQEFEQGYADLCLPNSEFEKRSRAVSLKPKQVLRDFVSHLKKYVICDYPKMEQAKLKVENVDKELKDFRHWRLGSDIDEVYAPLYSKLLLIESYINPNRPILYPVPSDKNCFGQAGLKIR